MPEPSSDLLHLAQQHLDEGRANEALEAAARGLSAGADARARALFAACVAAADRLPAVPGFRRQMVRALREAWARPAGLTGPALALVKGEPTVAAGARAAMAWWPRRIPSEECGPVLRALAADELLRAVLDTAPVNDPALERLLTSVRSALLGVAVHAKGEATREILFFAASLARQCHNNEYVFDVSDFERQSLAWLRTTVRLALSDRSPVLAIQLVALATYAPLAALERDRELTGRSWVKPLEALIAEQVRELQAEAALRTAMPRLTAITDAVSQQVRAQSEDSPYPRWIAIAATPPQAGIVAYLRGLFPQAPLRAVTEPEAPDILVAGCGSGQQPIGTAQRFPKARVLAVDLNLASLAYAKRKSDTGLALEYAQADILELEPDRRFDLVEATGVLHHLSEPMRGWAALVRLLKPGGFMRIGLYSELGRRDIAALRRLVAERGYTASADDIRRCRQDLISEHDPRFAGVLHLPDFASVSACRDLLFHVQEHRLTLPQIAAFLAEHRLTLLGFELDARALAAYRAAFPGDAAMTDLTQWDRFEAANPDTFRRMYQFWVQKDE